MGAIHRGRSGSAALAALALGAAGAGVAHGAPLGPGPAAQVRAVTDAPRYANALWAISVTDAVTGETVYARNPEQMVVPGSVTKAFTAAAALETHGLDRRFRTPVHRVGPVRDGVLRGDLVLVASGDFSFGLRERPGGTLAFADGGGDHNEANSLGLTTRVSGDPLRALDRLAADVRRSGIARVRGDVAIDDRLFQTYAGWPDGVISPIWVNENLIDVTVRPARAGRAARVTYRPRTAAYRVVSEVTTGRAGSAAELDIGEARPGVIRIRGAVPAGGGPTVRTWQVADPAAFARTAFIEALRRAGVRVDARATGPNPAGALPKSRRYPAATRLGVWTSPRFAEFVKVVLKVSYNRGADLLACLNGVRVGLRDCEQGLARTARTLSALGVPAGQAYNFDGAGSDDRNRVTPTAINTLMAAAARQPWGASFRAFLPQLGVPGGGDLGIFGRSSPARGKLQAKTGTRVGVPLGHPGLFLEARGMGGYLEGASGRALLATVFMNNTPITGIPDLLTVIEDQVRIAEAIQQGT